LRSAFASARLFIVSPLRHGPKGGNSAQVDRDRYAAPDRVPNSIRNAAAESLQYIADAPVLAHGRVELLWYMREQSLSVDYHRYGNLGIRADEERDQPT
jgi:RHH-type proline utilization regulon transcriptional repressor/proline dehydrogenase/delta 1-pyrroline-5-carboxylate dehydrogenase